MKRATHITADTVASVRLDLGWSQADMAEFLGLDGRQRVSDIERGRRHLSGSALTLFRFANQLVPTGVRWTPAQLLDQLHAGLAACITIQQQTTLYDQ